MPTASTSKAGMANNQVVLSKPFRSAYPSKVPMFLQKLYTILEDSTTDDVISWGEDGASFYVHDQDALAKQHLPHWFKHNKFASFVRQLNMYGFHKIPHLQQGLISENESSQFMHPHFHRGQEDQLILIERKKQAKDQVLDAESGGVENASAEGGFDMNTIQNAVTAIRRTQAQITQDLVDLKQADRVLWDEANKAHQRYQQQQDTINRIVKFLANLLGQLGHSGGAPNLANHKDSDDISPAALPQSRLLIEDAQREPISRKVSIVEVEDEDAPFIHKPAVTSSDSLATSPFSDSSSTNHDPRYPTSPTLDTFQPPNILTNALSTITPQDWAKVLSAFPDFLAPEFLSPNKRVAPPLPEGLIAFDTPSGTSSSEHPLTLAPNSEHLDPRLEETSRSADAVNGDIDQLSSMLGLPPKSTSTSTSDIMDLSAIINIPPDSRSATASPVHNNLRHGSSFNLVNPPPPKTKKRKSDVVEQSSPPKARKRRGA